MGFQSTHFVLEHWFCQALKLCPDICLLLLDCQVCYIQLGQRMALQASCTVRSFLSFPELHFGSV